MTEAIMVTPAGAGSSSRAKKMLVIGMGVVLVLYVIPKLFFGGGDGATDEVSVTEAAAPATALPGAAAPPVEETLRNYTAKNPFAPLFSTAPPSDSAGAPTESTDPAPAPTPVEPAIVVTDAPAVAPSPTGVADEPVTPAPPASLGPVRFGLVQVGLDASGLPFASVRVDGGVFQAVEGQEFGGSFKVVSLDAAGRCGVFLYGDQRFSLCEGEETTT